MLRVSRTDVYAGQTSNNLPAADRYEQTVKFAASAANSKLLPKQHVMRRLQLKRLNQSLTCGNQ